MKGKPPRKETIVFAKIGEAIKLNRRAVLCQDSLVDNNVMGFRPFPEAFAELFPYYYLLTIKLGDYSRATTVPSVRKTDVLQIHMPLPPFPEQQRIISKIEELFSHLDAGVEALEAVRVQIKRYRQAVLKYAFEGKLTEEWRNEHTGELELASVLLERIKEKRKKKEGKKYDEPPPIDTADFPDLPERWVWTILGELFCVSYGLAESLSKRVSDNEKDVPVIRIPNVTSFGKLDLEDLRYFPLEDEKKKKLGVVSGDVLFNWRNASKWIGKSAVFNQEGEYVNASFLLKLRPYIEGYSDYVSMYLNHLRLTGYFLTRVDHAVNQANFNATKTKKILIPFPPLEEQKKIMEQVERSFSLTDSVENTTEEGIVRADKLRQSILKMAFEGRLVPQYPNDEPAGKLLERIGAEKAKQEEEAKTKKVGAKKRK